MSDSLYVFKIIVAGQSNVGKTCLVQRFVDGRFLADTKSTIGVDFSLKNVTINIEGQDRKIAAQVWDMAGESRFRNILPYYCSGTQGIMLVFDCTNPDSMYALKEWIEVLYHYLPKEVPAILISGKNDLESKTSDEEIQKFTDENKMYKWFKTSSLSGELVNEAFIDLTKQIASKAFEL